jgi:RecB family exonuclease
VTVAVEVPIYRTSADITHMQEQLGFHIPLTTAQTITGHIDVLQIRNGRVHILDYKPGAIHERPIAQLMIYALAGLDHGIGHFMLFEVDSKAQASVLLHPKSP